MGRKTKNPTNLSDSSRPEPRMPWASRVVIAVSIPIYFALAWLLAVLLPVYSFVALVPVAFGIHSVVVLLLSWIQGRNSVTEEREDD
jgi:hypothetical protein